MPAPHARAAACQGAQFARASPRPARGSRPAPAPRAAVAGDLVAAPARARRACACVTAVASARRQASKARSGRRRAPTRAGPATASAGSARCRSVRDVRRTALQPRPALRSTAAPLQRPSSSRRSTRCTAPAQKSTQWNAAGGWRAIIATMASAACDRPRRSAPAPRGRARSRSASRSCCCRRSPPSAWPARLRARSRRRRPRRCPTRVSTSSSSDQHRICGLPFARRARAWRPTRSRPPRTRPSRCSIAERVCHTSASRLKSPTSPSRSSAVVFAASARAQARGGRR